MNSDFLKLNWFDVGKGLLLAVISAVLTTIQTSLSAGSLEFDWKAIGLVATTTCVAYLIKNVFTNSDGKVSTEQK